MGYGRGVTAVAVAPNAVEPAHYAEGLRLVQQGRSVMEAAARVSKKHGVKLTGRQLLKWYERTPERWASYVRAKQTGIELRVSEAHRIAATAGVGITDPALANVAVARARLEVDHVKWEASKLVPKLSGDKLQHEHSGSLSVVVATGVDAIPLASPTSRIGYSLGAETASMLDDATDAVVAPVAQVRSVADSFAALD